jgi:hypothetical protein
MTLDLTLIKPLVFQFLKDELKTLNLLPEVGDLLLFRNNFYEVDSK